MRILLYLRMLIREFGTPFIVVLNRRTCLKFCIVLPPYGINFPVQFTVTSSVMARAFHQVDANVLC